jgi:ABC-type multidrug transport system ATPase subunit
MKPDVLLEAEGLSFSVGGRLLLHPLSFTLGPGLHFVAGGEGRGKTTLLQLMAGTLQAQSGRLHRLASSVYFENPGHPDDDPTPARAWLDSLRPRFVNWDVTRATEAIDGFGLAEHIDKPMFMLSTGSRRKVGLVAALASGAALTLLDAPFAALDAASCRRLVTRLAQAAEDLRHAWVLADYELPAGLAGVPLAGRIDLGD